MATSLASDLSAIEITKVSAFVNFLEKNAPVIGDAATYTKNLAKGVQDQITQSGSCAFVGVFDQAKDVVPQLAMEGFAHAQGFTEYLVQKAPQVFSIGGKNPGLEIISTIQAQAPAAFETAHQVGSQAAGFVSQGGAAVFDQIKQFGGVISFLQNVHPEILASISPTLAIDFESVNAVKSGVTAAASAVAPAAKETASAMKDFASVAAPLVSSDLASAASAVGGFAASAASTIGNAFANIDAASVAQGTEVALNVIGSAAAVFPFLLPVQIALKDIGNAVQQATYNKESAEILKVRCTDCAKLISEMAPKIAKIAPSEAEQVAAVTPFVNAINEATEFLKKFSSRNFLMHMISWKREGRDVMFVDKKITDTLQNLSMRVNGYQVEIQVNTNQKVDQIMNMLNSIDLSQVKEPKDIAPEKLIEIIKAAGAESTEEIKKQMEFIGVQLEEVTKAINNLNENLSNVSQTITILSEQLTSNARDNEAIKDALVNQKENNDFMKDFLIQSVSTINQENTLTLNEIKNLILSGGGGSGKHELEVYCDLHKAAYLSTKANDVKQRVPHIILIHPHGVGFESYESLNGTDGANGRAGVSQQKARAGMHGNAATGLLNGADGEDGEDGGDGEHAEDAENGVDAGSFEVMIIFQKENKQAGTRTYRIEHSGPHGKIEEDIDIPIFNSMILIDGAGGRGGKGGDGGRGGDGGAGGDGGNAAHGNDRDREGGDGGNGGSGGEGGEGGEPGNGGNGGNGASIIVRTNDITILPMIEVDVSGGKGGFAGLVGAAGEGGLGGNPGEGGQGGVYFDGQTQRQGARGRRGKAGKKGKKGKSKQKKKSSAGTDGKLGKVSFCVYDDTGFKESGGTPYRTMIQKKDIPNLTPVPLNYGIPSTDRLSDPFVYGQMLQLGPVLPINIGSLYSPALQFIGRLVAHRILHTTSGRDLNKVSMLKFPPIPGEKSTRYGELQKNLAQSLKIDLPSLKELGLTLSSSSESWPWKPHYEKVPRSYSTFTFVFAFNGIVQKASVVDKDHVCRLDYTLNVEVPLEIISYQYGANPAALADVYSRSLQERKSQVSSPRTILTAGKIVNPSPELDFTLVQGGDAISAPRSILWHPSTMGFKISTFLYNRLQNTDFNKTNLARVVITVAGHHCYTNITNVSKGLATSPRINSSDGEIFAELPVDPKHDGFQRSSLISAVPYLPKGSSKELEFQLQINTKQKKPSSNDEIVVPAGTRLFVREELMYDEAIIEITPSHVVRIAPPWPPVTTTSPDILLFTDSTYTIKDFQIISQITQTLDLHIAFFDYEHFFSPNNNIQLLTIPPANRLMRITALPWESYLGKLTIAWFPTTNEFAAMANQPDFINHIKKSGGFMNGTCSNTVNPIQIPNELNNFLAKEMRNVVKLPNNFSIHSLKETNTDFSISSDRITGQPSILQYLIAIFITMKFEKKLQYLFANESKNILNIVVSTKIQLTDYQTEIEAGCCSCCSGKKSKVLPAKKSGLTIRDILLVAIRTELMMDLGSLPLTNKTEHCFAINGLLAYTDSLNLLNYRNSAAPKSIGYFARDLSAAITSANVLQKDKFADNRTNKIFAVLQKRLQLLVLTCQGLAADHQLDYQGFTERIIDLDILNGFSSRKRSVLSDHDPINVGSDIKLHISAILN